MPVTISGTAGLTANDGSVFTNASGNVGIGTGSPATKLDVAGPAAVTSFTGTTRLGVTVRGSSGTTDFSGIDIIGGGLTTPVARIAALTTGGGSTLSFGTSNSYGSGITNTAMTIDSSGNLLVGATALSNNERLNVTSGANKNAASFFCNHADDTTNLIVRHNRASGGTTAFMLDFLNSSGSGVGSIRSTGSSTSYVTSSDYRLKHDIQPMTGALVKVAALKPVTYKWKADDRASEGFIAHELAEVCPEAVCGEKDAVNEDGSIKPQGIDTSFLVATLTAAIQELKAINDAQAQTIESLTARVVALENQIV